MITATLPEGVLLRRVVESDAAALAEAYVRNREHLRPWDPARDDDFFTEREQAARIRDLLAEHAAGRAKPWVLAAGEQIVGGFNVSGIVMGPFRSGNLGYWVDQDYNGRGLGTAAVQAICGDARLGLHRLQAATLLENAGSQRLLAKCGFERIGMAPEYLLINGAWRDHYLFQRILG